VRDFDVIPSHEPEPLLAIGFDDHSTGVEDFEGGQHVAGRKQFRNLPEPAFRGLPLNVLQPRSPHGGMGQEKAEGVARFHAHVLLVVPLEMNPPGMFLGQFHQFVKHLGAGHSRLVHEHQAVVADGLLEMLVAKQLLQ
jgi:hypothetical protein